GNTAENPAGGSAGGRCVPGGGGRAAAGTPAWRTDLACRVRAVDAGARSGVARGSQKTRSPAEPHGGSLRLAGGGRMSGRFRASDAVLFVLASPILVVRSALRLKRRLSFLAVATK